MKTLIKTI